MKTRNNVYPDNETAFKNWFNLFTNSFVLHAAALGLSAEVAEAEADRDFLNHVFDGNDAKDQNLDQSIEVKKELLDGTDDGVPLVYPGAAVVAGPAPAGVPAGLVDRLNDRIARIRKSTTRTDDMEAALGILLTPPPAVTEATLAALVPVLIVLLSGMNPLIKWKRKRGTDALRIEADYGAGWVFLLDDTRPHHMDMHALPPAGTAQVWRYRAIYVRDGQPVGSYSLVYELTVKGN